MHRHDHPVHGSCPSRLIQTLANPNIFAMKDKWYRASTYILWVHNDNVRHFNDDPNIHKAFLDWYGKVFQITGGNGPLADKPPQQVLGVVLTYGLNHVAVGLPEYVLKLLTKYGVAECNKPNYPTDAGKHNHCSTQFNGTSRLPDHHCRHVCPS